MSNEHLRVTVEEHAAQLRTVIKCLGVGVGIVFDQERESALRLLPNLLTCSRLIAAVCLVLLDRNLFPFWLVYLWCGFSDVADGYLARKLNAQSSLGSALDSIADFALVLAVLQVFGSDLLDMGVWFLMCVAGIAVLRASQVISVALGASPPEILHRNSSRYLGAFLFVCPFFTLAVGFGSIAWIAVLVAGVTSFVELAFWKRKPVLGSAL